MYRDGDFLENLKSLANVFMTLSELDAIIAFIEICVITFIVYRFLMWIKDTRAWNLLRGLLVIGFFVSIVQIFQLKVLLWIISHLAYVAVFAIVIVFQNDIRAGLEHLGRQSVFSKLIPSLGKFTKKTSDIVVEEIVDAAFAMGKVKTGALIVIEQRESLEEIERTGIAIDGKVSKQLLVNIFEKNTPLHDGAVLIVGDIIKAATCYLPLSQSKNISKDFGTRHRAALGMSEASDSVIIVVSEETGNVSVCYSGEINTMSDEKELTRKLKDTMYNDDDTQDAKKVSKSLKGWFSNEKKSI